MAQPPTTCLARATGTRVYEGGFALSDREPQSQPSGAQGPEWLPKFDYYLDESDPDVVVLRRPGRHVRGRLSASGVAGRASSRPQKEDYAALLSGTGSAGEGPRGAREEEEGAGRGVRFSSSASCSRASSLQTFDAPQAHLVLRASFVGLEPLIQHAERAKESLYLGLLRKVGSEARGRGTEMVVALPLGRLCGRGLIAFGISGSSVASVVRGPPPPFGSLGDTLAEARDGRIPH